MEREIYTSDSELIISLMTEDDKKDYLELKRQVNGDNTLFLNPMTKDMLWEQVMESADKVYTIMDAYGSYCGCIEIQNSASTTPELGIELLSEMRNKGIAPKAITLFSKKFSEQRQVDYFVIRILSSNTHSKHVFEKLGAVNREFFDEEDDDFVCCYKLETKNLR